MLMMLTVMFALYSIFDMGIRVFSFGNNKVEAVQNARVGLEKMERETRAAYPVNPPADNRVLDGSASNSSRITFWNKLDTGTVAISYYASGGDLVRQVNSGPVQTVTALGAGGSIEFKYYHKTTGAQITNPSTDEPNIGMVQIKLVVDQDGREQELTTNVALRNRQ